MTQANAKTPSSVLSQQAPAAGGWDPATLLTWYRTMHMGRTLDDKAPNYLKQAIGWSYHAPCAGHAYGQRNQPIEPVQRFAEFAPGCCNDEFIVKALIPLRVIGDRGQHDREAHGRAR